MAEKQTYLLRGGLATLGQLAFLVALYITVGWLIVSNETVSMEEARARYDAMFPAFLHAYGVRQILSIFASLFAFTLSFAALKHLGDVKRAFAIVVMVLSPVMTALNLFWLM
jgi:hypothetical protein